MNPFRTQCLTAVMAVALSAVALPAQASGKVYRCGNEYTNSAVRIQQGGCVPLSGGNLTIVRGGATARGAARPVPVSSPAQRRTVDDHTQRTRDAGARSILQAELGKASTRLAELQKEYNNGEPEKMGSEARNYQKYLDRVAELKASIARTESDIAGLRRELGRVGS